MIDNEKRSTDKDMPLGTALTRTTEGVGARHKQTVPDITIGGYLDICSISDSAFTAKIRKIDPRLQQLREMGIGKTWLRVADVVGFEAFMGIWMILGEDESIRIRIPPYSKFRRYQRNQLIKDLSEKGLRCDQIKKFIKKQLCEDVSIRHIDRICAKGKIDK